MYTMKDFISGKIAVHTGLDSQKFLELCGKHDLKWNHGDKATAWTPSKYHEDTCIVCESGRLMHGPKIMFGTSLAKHIVVKPEDIAEMAPKYTMKDFIEKPIVVCVGKKHGREFLEMCEAEGLKWRHGVKPTQWVPDVYGDELCITLHCKFGGGNLMAGDMDCYMRQNLTIVDFTDIVPNIHHYRIVIDCRDDKVTEARMMVDGKAVADTIARRNPVDEFDFGIGAKVAFDRLFDKEPDAPVESTPPVREVKRPAKPGDYIKIVAGAEESADEYKIGDILKVIEVDSSMYPSADREPHVAFYKNDLRKYANYHEYVVLEGYTPAPESKPVHKFKAGDRVKCIKAVDHNDAVVGKYGTVKCVQPQGCYAVEFDAHVKGHDCCDECKNGHGWWCPPDAPEPISHEFKVGDRVKCTQVYCGNLRVKNAHGTVKIVNEQQIGVEFDEDVGGHTLNKYAPQAKRGRGWYCSPEVLEHED